MGATDTKLLTVRKLFVQQQAFKSATLAWMWAYKLWKVIAFDLPVLD